MIQHKYGILNVNQLTPLEVELQAFLLNPPASVGGLGRAEHFWNIALGIWGPQNKTKSFQRNPWTERMAEKAATDQYVGLNGAAVSGKSEFGAVWAIISWLCAPKDTLVMCTSTSLKESQRRIWGRIKQFWQAAPGLPGKLVDSMYIIRTEDGSGIYNDASGIVCIAGEKKDEKEAIGKMIGAHPKRLILIADELPELTEAILTAALSNLSLNPYFQMIGLGNFKSLYDPFGVFCRPKLGYDSISVEDDEWETELGVCLHFDGTRSPNILEGTDKYLCYNAKNLAAHKKTLDPNSAEFWRMCRSFPAPIGTSDTIFSEADMLAGKATDFDCLWLNNPTRISAMDPSFTSGGDRAVQMIGSFGQCADGIFRLRLERTILLSEDVNVKAPRDYQIARKFRDNCIQEGVLPKNASLDTSGAGSVLYSVISEEWDSAVLPVNFSGAPSENFVRANDTATAKSQFDRRVSELWSVGREYIKYSQIRGVTFDLARELKARKYDTIKSADGLKVSVEQKKDMKKRLGFSPDLGDCFVVMIELCRQRFRWLAGGEATGQNAINKSWEKELEISNALYEGANYSEEFTEEMTSLI